MENPSRNTAPGVEAHVGALGPATPRAIVIPTSGQQFGERFDAPGG